MAILAKVICDQDRKITMRMQATANTSAIGALVTSKLNNRKGEVATSSKFSILSCNEAITNGIKNEYKIPASPPNIIDKKTLFG
jgi:hypothetical protein